MTARAAYTLEELVEDGLTSQSIHDAVASGIPATEILREYVAQRRGMTVWTLPARADLHIVRQLFRFGARADERIMHDALNKDRRLFTTLIEEGGGDVDAIEGFGRTLLMCAAFGQDVEATRILLEHGADVNIIEGVEGQTALHYAAQSSADVLEILLQEPTIDVNVKTFEGKTPLMVAAEHHCQYCVRLLLKNPSLDLTAVDNEGVSTLDYIDRYERHLSEYARSIPDRRRWDSKSGWIEGIMRASQSRPY
jgi:ankyrin repeat protein